MFIDINTLGPEGLAFDRCQVAVVTNIGAGDHLGLNFITTVEHLSVLKLGRT